MRKVVYRERVEIISSILQAPAKSEGPVSKHELWSASKTSSVNFNNFYNVLIQMGCLKEEKSNDTSRDYDITITHKGLNFLREASHIIPYLEEFKKYWKEE